MGYGQVNVGQGKLDKQLIGKKILENQGGLNRTLLQDYDVLIFSACGVHKRQHGSAGNVTVTRNGVQIDPLLTTNAGNYGYNTALGKDMDQINKVWIFTNVKKGDVVNITGQGDGFNTSILTGLYY